MSDGIKLSDHLLSTNVKASPTNNAEYLPVITASGSMSRIRLDSMSRYDIAGKEEAGSTISLTDFTRKYITGKPVGYMISDTRFSNAEKFNIKLREGLVVTLQDHTLVITHNTGTLDTQWACITFMLFPAYNGTTIYKVRQMTAASSEAYTLEILRLAMEQA